MTEFTPHRLALVLAIMAELEAMKLQNQLHPDSIETQGYKPHQFFEKAEELRNLAYAHDMQLFY